MRAAFLVAVSLSACSEKPASGADGASPDATVDRSAAGGAAADAQWDRGADAHDSAVPPGDGSDVWRPTGDPEWTAIPWLPTCSGLWAAKNPEHAAPPLVWGDCGDGCRRLVVNFEYYGPRPFGAGQVFAKLNGRERFVYGLQPELASPNILQSRYYDENGQPVAATRGDATRLEAPCYIDFAGTMSGSLCLLAARYNDPPLYALMDLGASLLDAPSKTFVGKGGLQSQCADGLYVAQSQVDTWIWDPEAGTETELDVPGEGWGPTVRAGRVLMPVVNATRTGEVASGWLWRPPGPATLLVDSGGRQVRDLRTDGKLVAWLSATAVLMYDEVPGELWVSPLADSPAGLVPRKVADVPLAPSGPASAMGGGYYAVGDFASSRWLDPERRVRVYRLSDFAMAEVPVRDGMLPLRILWLDAEEIVLSMGTPFPESTVARFRMDVLFR